MFKEGAAMVEAEGEVMYLLALKMEGGPHPRNLGAPRNTALLTLDFCLCAPLYPVTLGCALHSHPCLQAGSGHF